jgi:predicted metalloprotease
MRWQGGRRSDNIEDRRSLRAGPGIALGGGGLLVALLVATLLGADPLQLISVLNDTQMPTQTEPAPQPIDPRHDPEADFVSVVLADTEDVWQKIFTSAGRRYQDPRLVLFRDQVRSACGLASAAVGPFYCPADAKVYLDLAFFSDLSRRFGAPGDFARAYVVAHEIGHHVQNLSGVSEEVQRRQRSLSQEEGNALSVRVELQADCYAGVWAHHANVERAVLEPGDIEEALGAATAIGDDRLQRQAQGYVVPESFTHGSSAQRTRWFRRGFDSGNPDVCDTFAARDL